jgi:tetratricopeptide (TPR) repeat protein
LIPGIAGLETAFGSSPSGWRRRAKSSLQMHQLQPAFLACYLFILLTCFANTLAQTESNSEIARQLWLNRITPPQRQEDTKYKQELQELIKQIRSVKFEPKNKPAEPFITNEPTPVRDGKAQKTSEPNEITTITGQAQESIKQKVQSETDKSLPYKPVTEETLQTLHKLATDPQRIHNHFELGEILFLSGHLKEAAIFYKYALKQMSQDDSTSANDKAWIILQIANCIKDEDPQAAKKMYRQLITEYPNSPWTDFAQARERLTDWYLTDKPLILIDENGQAEHPD